MLLLSNEYRIMQHLQQNTLLQGGKYKIERVLGQGGFGITYLATQELLDRKVCIKEFFFKDSCSRKRSGEVELGTIGNRDLVERFLNKFIKEARTISQLDHPNIIRILDIFKENNTAYYVMDFIEGSSLDDIVNKRGALPEREAVDYIKQVASALDYIHQRSINHLDVKPANIMVRNDNKAILIDFGVSKQYDEQGEQTSTTPVGISYGYAPLEQYRPGGVSEFSPQADIYSLGATLYRLLTGKIPPQAMEILNDGLTGLPSNISQNVKKALLKAMQIKKGDRPQNMKEFLNTLNISNAYQKTSSFADSKPSAKETTVLIKPTQPKNEINGHEYVDLGLPSGLKWATCNIGASNPEEYGDYFAWGEIETKNQYDVTNCITMEVVNSSSGFKTIDRRDNFQDAAQTNWGYGWRVPTMVEMEELRNKCTWNWISKNEVNGCEIIGPNGNSIFLPASGYINGKEYEAVNESGLYLTSTPYGDDDDKSYMLFYHGDYSLVLKFSRSIGIAVRPVCQTKTMVKEHDCVDLGLSVRWATCNIGADMPHECGNYYSWGETTTKLDYNEDNNEMFGKSMFDINGNTNYDAATVNWGKKWRMPTSLELEELLNKCTWSIINQNGVNGCKVIGTNGNSIFLPAAGCYDMESCELIGERGIYWSSSPCNNNEKEARALLFNNEAGDICGVGRPLGLTIRPVQQHEQIINGHEYVDLGLSVKWATCNVGANNPYETGNRYAWGETSTKDNYTKENCDTIDIQKKQSFFGVITKEIIIDKKENFKDAAKANWGGTWRMPTQDEIEELLNKCKWEKTKREGNSVCKITGPNGNSIFIPYPEHCIKDQNGLVGSTACFWSSTPYANKACYLFFFSNNNYVSVDDRYNGRAIRPVTD